MTRPPWRVDRFLAHPPARMWRALTDSDLLARGLMPNDFRPLPGHRFRLRTTPRPGQGFDGVVDCEVLEIDEPRRTRWAWRGTRLFLEHSGFDPDDSVQRRTFTLLDGGWRGHVWPRLAGVLVETA
ncbi:SRPBCC family protein [Micromonospora auratinigra]|uniref:Activator of Hsp90 ATPase homolog 1-like protein n=1 Tax=Micromonospora auratinigra TaxID=261654 RepID=A0A1A8ZJ81_9ACTN|nr:SRPBCC domain-containing protein [Micromonospora auratinigra]SBT43947.1 Activator of Hsp90 ATPase homolog 1-like protein [Micromonospora auratinigra]